MPDSQNSLHFFASLLMMRIIGHNVIGILNLVWAVSSEPIKIKSTFFLLWAGYEWVILSPISWYVTMYRKGVLNEILFCLFFQWFAVSGLLKIVLAKILSLFKSTKPYLWHMRLISHAFHKNPQPLCWHFWLLIS